MAHLAVLLSLVPVESHLGIFPIWGVGRARLEGERLRVNKWPTAIGLTIIIPCASAVCVTFSGDCNSPNNYSFFQLAGQKVARKSFCTVYHAPLNDFPSYLGLLRILPDV